jgi:hypothetical protein
VSLTNFKTQFKWIKDLNVRTEAMKLLRENTGNASGHKNERGIVLAKTLKAQETKAKIDKWDYIKLKNL